MRNKGEASKLSKKKTSLSPYVVDGNIGVLLGFFLELFNLTEDRHRVSIIIAVVPTMKADSDLLVALLIYVRIFIPLLDHTPVTKELIESTALDCNSRKNLTCERVSHFLLRDVHHYQCPHEAPSYSR